MGHFLIYLAKENKRINGSVNNGSVNYDVITHTLIHNSVYALSLVFPTLTQIIYDYPFNIINE